MTKLFGELKKEIQKNANRERAEISQRFFKTGPGEYGEGDVFVGIAVPRARYIAKKYSHVSLGDVETLMRSKIHEERLIALLILVEKNKEERNENHIQRIYLKNMRWVNNWDLVDLSADKIVGRHLYNRKKDLLFSLAKSENVWERRIATIATFYFIKNEKYDDTLKIAKMLMNDTHDLIHKAVGWMLREIGKRSLSVEEKFLKTHYKKMPRTMLRYAIERFPEAKRKRYLKGEI